MSHLHNNEYKKENNLHQTVKPPGLSSVDRALDCHGGGQGFKPQTGPTLRVLTH